MNNCRAGAKRSVLALLAASLCGLPVAAQEVEDDGPKLDVYGDFRLRIESDWGTNEPDGGELEGRTRARVRVRLGATFSPDDHVTLGLRLRSGLIEGQQVANITIYDFDGNNTGDADFLFDKWFLEYRLRGLSAWVGRNSIPYWKQNQLYWDDEVIPVGFGVKYGAPVGAGNLEVNGGLFSLPAGMQAFSGRMLSGQVVYDHEIGNVGVTAAAGVLAIAADREDPDRLIYLDENGDRDYTTLQVSVQTRIQAWTAPLRLGVDLALNTEGYDDAPSGSFTEFHRGEDVGCVLSATWGDAAEVGDWQVGYSYAYVETFAVNNSFAQDDWVRWGTAEQIRNSNFKGHGFHGIVALPARFSVVGRIYLVKGITLRSPTSTQPEDGNRVRLDVNYRF
jgi:hypothetical protein